MRGWNQDFHLSRVSGGMDLTHSAQKKGKQVIKKLKLAQQRQSRLVQETNLVKVQSDTSIVVQPPSITAQIQKNVQRVDARAPPPDEQTVGGCGRHKVPLLNKQEAPTCKSSAWLCFCHCQLASQRCSGQSRENVRLQEPSMALMYKIHSGTEDPQHISVVLFLLTNKRRRLTLGCRGQEVDVMWSN